MRFFNNNQVLAFISDARCDFTPEDFNAPLTEEQYSYLKDKTDRDIPQVFWRRQVHGDEVLVATQGPSSCRSLPDADAYVTKVRRLPIAIRTADCVPVLIFDPVTPAIGVAHAGWKGTHKGIAAKTVKALQEHFGSRVQELQAAIGPCIRSCCYQVGEEFKKYFPQEITERSGSLYADMIAANRRQLLEAGVRDENITDSQACTCCGSNYFSFRRDGAKAGRMISLMMLV